GGYRIALEIIDPGPGYFYFQRMRLVVERQAALRDRHAMHIMQRPRRLGSVAKNFDEPRRDLELDWLAAAALHCKAFDFLEAELRRRAALGCSGRDEVVVAKGDFHYRRRLKVGERFAEPLVGLGARDGGLDDPRLRRFVLA